jgi:hypothetical protein
MALAEAHMSRVPGATFDDFAEGKGRGLKQYGSPPYLNLNFDRLMYKLGANQDSDSPIVYCFTEALQNKCTVLIKRNFLPWVEEALNLRSTYE